MNSYRLLSSLKEGESQISFLEKQVVLLKKVSSKLIVQEELSGIEYNYKRKKLNTDSILFNKKIISSSEYDKSRQDIVPYEKAITQVKQNAFQNELSIAQLMKQINDLFINKNKDNENLKTDILIKSNVLIGNILAWEDRNLFKSNIKGEVSLVEFGKMVIILIQGMS
ncbi:hypothetical protein [Pedobacter sp. NJ-S-72]